MAGIGSIFGGGAMFVYDTFVIDDLYDEIEDLEDEVEFADDDQQMLDEGGSMPSMEDLQNSKK